jgi:hypothetical protein
VLKNDDDEDWDVLTVTGVSGTPNGQVTFEADRVNYVPNPGFTGSDVFYYTVEDGEGGSAVVTVTVQVLPTGTGSRVFADANADGIQDPGERGVPHVLVHVLDSLGNVVASVETDDNGYYFLPPDLLAGNYRLQFVLPYGLETALFSPPDEDSDVDVDGFTEFFIFDPQQGWPDIDAGVVVDPSDPSLEYLFG